ncbi:MAG TPA: hypothetical protein VHP83_01020 [Aggregatilineaceae bacterium]|nr:hypothetical protein [Aggregatilineaceae bacterium]
MARRRTRIRSRRVPRLAFPPLILVAGLIILLVAAVIYSNSQGEEEASAERLPVRGASVSGVSFRLPSGWAYDQVETRTRLANRTEALYAYPPNPGDVLMTIRAPFPKSLYGDENSSITAILSAYAPQTLGGENVQIGGAQEITINGKPAARASLSSDTMDGFVVAFEMSGMVLAVTVETSKGALNTYESTALEVISAIRYSQPAPPPTLTPTS